MFVVTFSDQMLKNQALMFHSAFKKSNLFHENKRQQIRFKRKNIIFYFDVLYFLHKKFY